MTSAMHPSGPSHRQRGISWVVGAAGVVSVGVIDYLSGTEFRVYPLYFAPIALIAWHGRRADTIAAATLSAASWLIANMLAGMRFSTDVLWAANTAVHAIAFLFVGLLITALRAALKAARELSRTDPLTQLRNSRAFYEDARPLLALCRRTSRPVTLAYIDLDHFKSVNDTHGHEAGDTLLQHVAHAMQQSVRPSDMTARLGGDEFAVFLPELGAQEAGATLERLRQAVAAAVQSATQVTASVGGITLLQAPAELEAIIQRADHLMYDAKAKGRNRVSHQVVAALAPPAAASPSAGGVADDGVR